jgi:hypothetical protein
VRVRAVARVANLVVYLFILLVYLVIYHKVFRVGFVKMRGYQRQSAIALDRYDLEYRVLRELVFELERRMRLRENPWRRFRRRASRNFQ